MIGMPDFRGNIHDVGGPTANFRRPSCQRQLKHGVCRHRECLGTNPCSQLEVDHRDYVKLLRRLRKLPGVKKVFVRSGIRYDYVVYDKEPGFMRELTAHHVSGQLKVAPEHVSSQVLHYMGKPERSVYDRFVQSFNEHNRQQGKEQYLIPYFMSSHPGSTLADAIELAEFMRDSGQRPEQVQDFYPTPGTASTCMYYTGLDPRNMKPVYVPKDPEEKAMQRALMHYYLPQNHRLVIKALQKAERTDLIGFGARALVRPLGGSSHQKNAADGSSQGFTSNTRSKSNARPKSNKTRSKRRSPRPAGTPVESKSSHTRKKRHGR